MGLFNKSVTQVGTSVNRAIEDKALPDSIMKGFARSIFEENASDQMTTFIMDELVAGVGMRVERMYEYGRKSYVHGLPTANIVRSSQSQPLVKKIIEAEVGAAVKFEYYQFGSFNNLHAGWTQLVKHFGYDQFTNEITVLTTSKGGLKCYLVDMEVVVADATEMERGNTSLEQWSVAPNAGPVPGMMKLGAAGGLKPATPFRVNPGIVEDYVKVTYSWEETTQVVIGTATTSTGVINVLAPKVTIKEASFNIVLGGFNTNVDWHQVKYTYGNVTKYWMYQNGSGMYPSIDTSFDKTHDNLGSFFPFAYLRFNKQAGNTAKNSTEYKSSKKLLNYLNMDYDTVVDGIHENPDIKDVEQAMIVMAVPAITTDPMEQRYLFEFFNRLYATLGGDHLDMTQSAAAVKSSLGTYTDDTSIIIQDNRFKMALGYRNIIKRTMNGRIGKIGSHSSRYIAGGLGVADATVAVRWSILLPHYIYCRQITDNLYEELFVYNLHTVYHIFGEYSAVGNDDDKTLLVPLDHSITKEYNSIDREHLYARSLHYVFNSRLVTKLKWYQTPIFRAIIIIIAIILTIIDLGADGGSWIAGALALTGYAAIAVTVIFNIIVGKIIGILLSKIAKEFGGNVAIILAVIAIIYGAYESFNFGSIAGAPWASEMLQVANGLFAGAMEDKFNDLLLQKDQFKLLVTEQEKTLDIANKLLGSTNFLAPIVIFGENPQQFYERSVHSGNIGVLSFDALSSYVDNALTLPSIMQTLGK